MFKNFSKVFKFTFKNQVEPKGYRNLTIIMSIILLIAPVLIFLLVNYVNKDKKDPLKPCNADKVYVVNDAAPDADYSILNMMNVDGYTAIFYTNADSVEDALKSISDNGEKKSLILQFKVEDNTVMSRVVLPKDSEIEEDDAKNLDKFIEQNGSFVSILASGIDMQDITAVAMRTDHDIYKASGYEAGTSIYDDEAALNEHMNNDIKPIFAMILTYLIAMVMYFIIIYYGNGITQNIVLEKSSKLMDTMLISVKPEAMIFGKMLAVLSAALLQFFSWVVSLALGVLIAVKTMGIMYPDNDMKALTFIKGFKDMGLFKPVNVMIGILVLIFGIIFYAAISAICGAISSTKEEAASNQSVFVIVLLISFYAVLFGGLKVNDVSNVLFMIPCTGAMVLPAGVCAGTVSTGIAAISLAIMIVTTILLVILAGRLYKMMALYKGNKVNLSKALKMLFSR